MPFVCTACGERQPSPVAVCPACGGFVRYRESNADALRAAVAGDARAALPEVESRVELGEGETPLVGLTDGPLPDATHAKLESLNPSCSFKDRGSALALSHVRSDDTSFEAVVVASTGNTATSVATYAARASVPCAVLLPEGTSTAKLTQAAAAGARLFTVEGTFSDCFALSQRVADDRVLNATAVYSANPYVASANRTVAFELVRQLGTVPDWVSVPVGAGPLLGGTYAGFEELREAGLTESAPRMLCVQARGCHPIVRAFERGEPVSEWTGPITTAVGAIADPLRGYPEDGEHTRRAVLESGGAAVALPDDRIHEWHARLAAREGVYAEPASAASVAALAECTAVGPDDVAVALVTGHGLKEPTSDDVRTTHISDDPDAVRDTLLR
ncbi:threonine synthase [Halegenticoccus soli]|uniref:threonine synthase n=1 Tax=Halegenticoccus soli TaxID=1985678 RepID=UPI000C6E6F91|nr:threonine synthase [Halegenticoccus soli]